VATFTPVPFQIVDTPEQLKGFTDPLRSRILSILCEREATNQQLAHAIGEPHAKVLHHVRVLLDVGLITLVDTRIKGGNVEKYYRAVARMFGIRPGPELRSSVAAAEFEAVAQEVAAAAALWPESPEYPNWEGRRKRLAPERREEFHRRLLALIAEYWGGPQRGESGLTLSQAVEDPDAPMFCFATVIYRDPTDPQLSEESQSVAPSGETPDPRAAGRRKR
jgi:DNA-binding transcriptional ArsR family regulator